MQKYSYKSLLAVLFLCFGIQVLPALAYERVLDIEVLEPSGEPLQLRLNDNNFFLGEADDELLGEVVWEGDFNEDTLVDYIIVAGQPDDSLGRTYTALLALPGGFYQRMPLGVFQQFDINDADWPQVFCGFAVTHEPENGEWDSVVSNCSCYGYSGQMYFMNDWSSYNVPSTFEETCPREPLREAFENGLGMDFYEDYDEDYSEPELPFNPGEITWHKPESYLAGVIKVDEKTLRVEGLEFSGKEAVMAELLWSGDMDFDNLSDYLVLVPLEAAAKELVALTSQLDEDGRLLYSVVRLGPASNLTQKEWEHPDETIFYSHERIETEGADIYSCTTYHYMGDIVRLFDVQMGQADNPEMICNFERLMDYANENAIKYWDDDSDNLSRVEPESAVTMADPLEDKRLRLRSYDEEDWPNGEKTAIVIWSGKFPAAQDESYVVQTEGLDGEPQTVLLEPGEYEGEKYFEVNMLGNYSGVLPFEASEGEKLCVYKYETIEDGRVRTTCDCFVPWGKPYMLGNSLTDEAPWDNVDQVCPREDMHNYMTKLGWLKN